MNRLASKIPASNGTYRLCAKFFYRSQSIAATQQHVDFQGSPSDSSSLSHEPEDCVPPSEALKAEPPKPKPMTMAERDARMKEILDDRSGDGGVAGLELEDGLPVAMKRGVRDNMFRLI